MDKPRTGHAEKRRLRRTLLFVAIGIVVVSITVGISRLEPAAPQVDKETQFTGEAQRGTFLRDVRGSGTLVPVDIRLISLPVEGRVERIPALPGVTVTPDTIILELSNPELEQNLFEAESQLRAGEADLDNLRAQLDSQLLSQQSQVASADSDAEQARLQAEADQKLFEDQLKPQLEAKLSSLRASQLTKRASIEKERYESTRRSNLAQLAGQRARVEQSRALYELRRRQVEALKVKAGISGVLQELPGIQVGARITPGTTLARVAQPERLKAELRIPEVLAKDVTIGLAASIDTRNGIVPGHVMRVAPSVQEGTVTVDVALDGPLPKGARPDLSIDGTVLIERVPDVVYIPRPSFGSQGQKLEMFKLVDGGTAAVRVPVQFGRSSVQSMEIVSGLKPGDKVILSETSQFDGHDRIRLN